MIRTGHVVALSGGIGGAKLAFGLLHVLEGRDLTIVANTGDDFEHLGLTICPDIDTLLYTLAGLNDSERGWGRRNETWTFMKALAEVGGPTWFRLGDGDLAVHIYRAHRLANGASLSAITDELRQRLGIGCRLLPMSDDPIRTKVRTSDGWLDFQEYFVRLDCEPSVLEIAFEGVASASPNAQVIGALQDPELRAVVICPSNPLISIEPILAMPDMRKALAATRVPVIAVSPIVSGRALKGPAAKMLRELGTEPSAVAVAERYGDILSGYVVDTLDAADATRIDLPTAAAPTIMVTCEDRVRLARIVLEFADSLRTRDQATPYGNQE